MTAGDDIRAEPRGRPPGRTVAAARPLLVTAAAWTAAAESGPRVVLVRDRAD
jgi:hypothetical protein